MTASHKFNDVDPCTGQWFAPGSKAKTNADMRFENETKKCMLSDDQRYLNLQMRQEKEWEAKCGRCGACCGAADGDPCENLVRDTAGRYACRIYENRFGIHKTLSGREIKCVPIRDILHKSWPGDQCCGYKRS